MNNATTMPANIKLASDSRGSRVYIAVDPAPRKIPKTTVKVVNGTNGR